MASFVENIYLFSEKIIIRAVKCFRVVVSQFKKINSQTLLHAEKRFDYFLNTKSLLIKENINAKECVGQGVFVKWSKMKREIPLFDVMEMSSSESELWGSLDASKSPKYPASFDRSLVKSPLLFSVLHSALLKGDENHYERILT